MAPKLLDIITPDPCCAKRLTKDLAAGKIPADVWTCPKCNVEWRAEMRYQSFGMDMVDRQPYRKWAPHCPVIKFRV